MNQTSSYFDSVNRVASTKNFVGCLAEIHEAAWMLAFTAGLPATSRLIRWNKNIPPSCRKSEFEVILVPEKKLLFSLFYRSRNGHVCKIPWQGWADNIYCQVQAVDVASITRNDIVIVNEPVMAHWQAMLPDELLSAEEGGQKWLDKSLKKVRTAKAVTSWVDATCPLEWHDFFENLDRYRQMWKKDRTKDLFNREFGMTQISFAPDSWKQKISRWKTEHLYFDHSKSYVQLPLDWKSADLPLSTFEDLLSKKDMTTKRCRDIDSILILDDEAPGAKNPAAPPSKRGRGRPPKFCTQQEPTLANAVPPVTSLADSEKEEEVVYESLQAASFALYPIRPLPDIDIQLPNCEECDDKVATKKCKTHFRLLCDCCYAEHAAQMLRQDQEECKCDAKELSNNLIFRCPSIDDTDILTCSLCNKPALYRCSHLQCSGILMCSEHLAQHNSKKCFHHHKITNLWIQCVLCHSQLPSHPGLWFMCPNESCTFGPHVACCVDCFCAQLWPVRKRKAKAAGEEDFAKRLHKQTTLRKELRDKQSLLNLHDEKIDDLENKMEEEREKIAENIQAARHEGSASRKADIVFDQVLDYHNKEKSLRDNTAAKFELRGSINNLQTQLQSAIRSAPVVADSDCHDREDVLRKIEKRGIMASALSQPHKVNQFWLKCQTCNQDIRSTIDVKNVLYKNNGKVCQVNHGHTKLVLASELLKTRGAGASETENSSTMPRRRTVSTPPNAAFKVGDYIRRKDDVLSFDSVEEVKEENGKQFIRGFFEIDFEAADQFELVPP